MYAGHDLILPIVYCVRRIIDQTPGPFTGAFLKPPALLVVADLPPLAPHLGEGMGDGVFSEDEMFDRSKPEFRAWGIKGVRNRCFVFWSVLGAESALEA